MSLTLDRHQGADAPRSPSPGDLRPSPSLYRVIWRWHFYAGLIVAPILIIVAGTGALYIFRAELERLLYPNVMFITPEPTRIPLAEQLAAARAAAPDDYRPTRLEVSNDPTRATSVLFTAPNKPFRRLYVSPSTGSVLGQLGPDSWFRVILDLHRRLFLGSSGRMVVELTTCWTIVLLLTGLYLWWPRQPRGVKGVLIPRTRAKPYVVLRDWHTIMGFYFVPIVLLIASTGQIYSLVWGTGYRYLAEQTQARAALRQVPNTRSNPKTPDLPLESVFSIARTHCPHADEYNLTISEKAGRAWMITATGKTGPTTQGVLVLEHATGEVLSRKTTADLPLLAWWSSWNYPLHVGSVLGLPTKIIWLVACLVLIALPATGLWMWWQRRPTGKTGFPRRPDTRVPCWLVGVIVLLGVLMPVVGASIVLILLGEALVLGVRAARAWART